MALLSLLIPSVNGQVGTYRSTSAGFEWGATLVLKEDNRFEYHYGLLGCQGKMTGEYQLLENEKISFIYDEEYTDEFLQNRENRLNQEMDSLNKAWDTDFPIILARPCYPDLNEGNWKFTRKGIRQRKDMKCECWSAKGLYKKD
ncbi:MAG: hypothetical protein AAF740_08110 [Bacteroidota bacterium]